MIPPAVQGIASQGLSSVSNFTLVVLVARSTTASEFGAFAVGYSLVLLAVEVIRGYVGETLSVTLGGDTSPSNVAGAGATGGAVLLGVASAAFFAVASLAWPGEMVARWMLLFAPGVVLLVWQSAVRFVGFATRRPHLAVVSDGAWLIVQLFGWAALEATGMRTPAAMLVVWWLAAGTGAVAVTWATGIPSLTEGRRWLALHRRPGIGFSLEHLLQVGGSQGAVYAVGLVVGLPAAGALRGAQSLFGPFGSVLLGVSGVATPEAVRRHALDGPDAMLRYVAVVTGGLAATAAVVATAVSLVPDRLGRLLLGDTWGLAATVLPAAGAAVLGLVALSGVRLSLRALRRDRVSLIFRVVTSGLMLLGGVGGALVGGLVASAYALAGAQFAGAALGWITVARVLRRPVQQDRRPVGYVPN